VADDDDQRGTDFISCLIVSMFYLNNFPQLNRTKTTITIYIKEKCSLKKLHAFVKLSRRI
jgi:hypothetical protein